MTSLPGYDAWKLTAPRDTLRDLCVECGQPVPEDEPPRIADGWACSSECQAMHHLRHADGPADVLAAADVAYGEGCEFVLRVVDRHSGEMLCSHLARFRWIKGDYMAEDLDRLRAGRVSPLHRAGRGGRMTYPTLEQVEKAGVEELLRWNRYLPSPMDDHQVAVLERAIVLLDVRRTEDPAAYTAASKRIGWDG